MKDHYQTLGIDRTASDGEIKKAYRKLAGQHHPDKGGDTSRFQEIQEAYETLGDPQKRQQYDNPHPFQSGFDQFEFRTHMNMNDDIFTHIFQNGGFGSFRTQPRKNKDLRISITVPLASTLEDQNKTVNLQTTKGDTVTLDVTIPRGASDGTTIKYTGMGDNFFDSLPRGDLYVIINTIMDTRFEVNASNLVSTVEINSIEAILGIETDVTGLDEKIFKIKIPPGCQYGTRLCLRGQGLYVINSSNRGDLIIVVSIKTPMLAQPQLEQLQQLYNNL